MRRLINWLRYQLEARRQERFWRQVEQFENMSKEERDG